MRRREFIARLGIAAAWPLAAHAQQPVLPRRVPQQRISARIRACVRAFHQGLKEVGFVEGQNLAIEYRWAEGQYDRLAVLATDLVQRQVNVIATGGTPSALAAKAATRTIPIVFATVVDPVQIGLVARLDRPGGNLTGVTNLGVELGAKRLELLHELVPRATIIALLTNPTNANAETEARDAQTAARTLGLQLLVLHASTDRDLDAVFATLPQLRSGGLVIGADPFFTSRGKQLAALALRHAVPTIYQYREFANAGGLVSCGGSITDAYHQVGIYTGRILRGEKPGELPVQQSTRVEIVINLTTAKALGLLIPPALLARADEVIE